VRKFLPTLSYDLSAILNGSKYTLPKT